MCVYFFIWSPIIYCCKMKGYCKDADDDDVDEDLGTYFECVSPDDRKRWYTEEVYNRSKLGIETMTERTITKLREVKKGKK